ncbi:MAG: RibD family protein [Bellilinea sp.]
MDIIDTATTFARLDAAKTETRMRPWPWVTLSYAQTLDGCIAAEPGKPLEISSPETMQMTHRLRAWHDAILVGIGTVLADDPLLNVRLVEGKDPQPIILDSRLRTPLGSRLIRRSDLHPWIVCSNAAGQDQGAALMAAGAHLLRVEQEPDGCLSLPQMLECLKSLGIASIMVEGGSRVISSFLQAGLADWAVITISPRWAGGLPALDREVGSQRDMPHLIDPEYQQCGPDLVVSGRVSL